EVAHVTQTTIRKAYSHIAEELDIQEELEEKR
ncbi:MAG: transcription initiation factor TFIIIB Brf1 subunit/transcription initiation factor TFIIB, partial [Candidatus Nanohaloarchaea archaeon]